MGAQAKKYLRRGVPEMSSSVEALRLDAKEGNQVAAHDRFLLGVAQRRRVENQVQGVGPVHAPGQRPPCQAGELYLGEKA